MRSVHFDKMNDSYCCWRERDTHTHTHTHTGGVKAVLIIDVILADNELM